jgi:predicted RNA-binding protein
MNLEVCIVEDLIYLVVSHEDIFVLDVFEDQQDIPQLGLHLVAGESLYS